MSDDAETWQPVPGFPGYEVSDAGQVRSVPRRLADGRWDGGTVLAQSPDDRGYMRVHLRRDGRSTTRRVHVLVAEVFLGPRPAGRQILHRNDDKSRNGASDLRYGTARQNVWDRTRRERKERNKRRKKIATRQRDRVTPVATSLTRDDS